MAHAEARGAERSRGSDTDGGRTDGGGPVVVEAVLRASRVLVAVAARSLAEVAEEVTVPQYRALVVLASKGPQRVAALADALEVTPPTATRMCDRLVRKGLVRRRTAREDRREVRLSLTSEGSDLVAEVTRRRREEISRLLEQIPPASQRALVDLFDAFAAAAGEPGDGDWALGWEL
jgi:DNA-binding MarR family transcriptional regulator